MENTKLKDAKIALEDIIDKVQLEECLSMLEEICYEKAEHLRSNWQDWGPANEWDEYGKLIANVKERAFGKARKPVKRLEKWLDEEIG